MRPLSPRSPNLLKRFQVKPQIAVMTPVTCYLRGQETTETQGSYIPWLLEPPLSWALEPECRTPIFMQAIVNSTDSRAIFGFYPSSILWTLLKALRPHHQNIGYLCSHFRLGITWTSEVPKTVAYRPSALGIKAIQDRLGVSILPKQGTNRISLQYT